VAELRVNIYKNDKDLNQKSGRETVMFYSNTCIKPPYFRASKIGESFIFLPNNFNVFDSKPCESLLCPVVTNNSRRGSKDDILCRHSLSSSLCPELSKDTQIKTIQRKISM